MSTSPQAARSAPPRVSTLPRWRSVAACSCVYLLVAASCSDSEPEQIEPSLELPTYHEGRPRDGTRTPLDASDTPDAEPLDDSGPATLGAPRIASATRTRVPGIDPFSHSTMPLEELERFVAAAETLDRNAKCSPAAIPDSLDDYVEVFRIADGCMHIEYHPLNGRTISQARQEIKQADPTVHAVSYPSDDLLPDQSIGFEYSDYEQWHLEPMQAAGLQGGWPMDVADPVVVAVIDSGVHGNHPILDSRLVNGARSCHLDPHNNARGNEHNHGTHVAGIIAANSTPSAGVVGIAPRARIRSFKIEFAGDTVDSTQCRTPTRTSAMALAEVEETDASIVNMSLGAGKPCVREESQIISECEQEIRDDDTSTSELIIMALALQGVTTVTTAGNCGNDQTLARCMVRVQDPQGNFDRDRQGNIVTTPIHNRIQTPAEYEHTIAVASIDDNQDRANDSTANLTVDIAAPGVEILSTVEPTFGPNGVDDKSGTSMAAPMIAGVIAHMRARFPEATVNQITEALFTTARAQPGRTGPGSNCEPESRHRECYGNGIVQPLSAINYLAALQPAIVYLTNETGSNQIALIDREGKKRVVTTSSGMKWGPSLSPDGLRIVFARSDGLRNDLWVVNVDGSEERQLTSTSQPEYAPSWSPDGSQIVFFRDNSELETNRCGFLWLSTCKEYVQRPREIAVMNSDGSDERRLFSGEDIFAPQWTSDGTAILFDYGGDVASLDVASGNVSIVLGDGYNYCPSPSPDSRMIAYSSERTGNEEMYVMDADGTNRRRVTDDPATDRCPVWMPDGKSLVFTSDRDGDEEIYIMDIDGTGLRQLTDNAHRDFQPSVTKSGEAAAVIASTDLTIQRIDPLPAAVDAAGGEFAALSSSWDHVCSSLPNRPALCWGTSAGEPASAPPEAQTGTSAGAAHSCALDSGGAVVCWGSGFLGQTDAPAGTFRAVAAGWDHTCGLNSSGSIECWGSDQHGQASPPSGRFTAISAGDGHSCALNGSGTIVCWGLDGDGQASPPAGRFTAIDTGSAHSCALDEAGTITCWGANWFGQIDTPEGSFVEVAAGYGHTCALDEGGLATCWGLNNDYQANAPFRVFTTLTAGRAHTCALDIHAEVMCWGTIEPHDE